MLWGESTDARARDSFRHTLAALRKTLTGGTPQILVAEGQTLALNPAAVEIDVAAFEQAIATGTPETLERAAGLYRGDLLEGMSVSEPTFEEWLLAERERLRELAMEALAKLLAHHQGKRGSPERAIQTAIRLLALDPSQEVVHRALMRLYARQGRQGTALRQYQTCVAVLQRELGAEPEPETKQLYGDILRRSSASPPAGFIQARGAPAPGRTARAPAPQVPVHDSPLVGRDGEVAELRAAVDALVAGRGRVVVVLGEAGIGKSRLVGELAALVLARDATLFLGRCYESLQILPFGPWVDALRAGHVLAETDTLDALGDVWRAELSRLFPELGERRSADAIGGEDYLRLFEALARLLVNLANARPLVLVLEDLHWADEISLRFLAFFGRRIAAAPVVVIATTRDEDLADAMALSRTLAELRREPATRELPLERLSRDATATLVQTRGRTGRAAAQAAELETHVWRASEGNPLIAVETLRALEQGAALAGVTLPLPERVHALVTERLARLHPPARELASVASVIGREFEFALLQRAAGLGERKAAEAMEELVRRRILHGVGERFDFAHDRIREVVYGQLLPPRRRVLHTMVANALEELHAGDLDADYAALGVHYQNGQVWEKAAGYFRQAGRHAAVRAAPGEAAACFEQALASLQHLPESRATREQAIDVRLELRNVLIPLGRFDRILDCLRQAEALAQAADDRRRLARVSCYMTQYSWVRGDYDGTIAAGQRALALAGALGDLDMQAETNFFLGATRFLLGDYGRAVDVLAHNVAALNGARRYERFGLPFLPSVASRTFLVFALAERGEFAEGIRRNEEARAIAEAVDDPFSVIETDIAAGVVQLRRGDVDRAIVALERGLAGCRASSIALLFPWAAANLGYAYALSGRAVDGLPLLVEAIERTASMGLLINHSLWLGMLGEARLLEGGADDALRHAERALQLSRDYQERGHQAWAYRLLGEILSRRKPVDIERAKGCYRDGLILAGDLEMRPLVAYCHLGLGELYRKAGKPLDARAELTAAADLYRAMEMTFWLARAEAALGARP